MSEVQSRPATRGRGSARGGRGGFSSRGGRSSGTTGHSNGNDVEHTTAVALEDQGELGQLKKQYSNELSTLSELFPDWTDDDLVIALQETGGDVQNTVERITEGAEQPCSIIHARSSNKHVQAMSLASQTSKRRPVRSQLLWLPSIHLQLPSVDEDEVVSSQPVVAAVVEANAVVVGRLEEGVVARVLRLVHLPLKQVIQLPPSSHLHGTRHLPQQENHGPSQLRQPEQRVDGISQLPRVVEMTHRVVSRLPQHPPRLKNFLRAVSYLKEAQRAGRACLPL